MCDGDGEGAGSGGSVGGIGAESDAVGTGFGVDADSAADANSFSGTVARGLSAFANSLDPTAAPTTSQDAIGRGMSTTMGAFGMGPIGSVMGLGMAATAAAEAMGIEPGSSDPGAGNAGVDGPSGEGGDTGQGGAELPASSGGGASFPLSGDGSAPVAPIEPTPIVLPDPEPVPDDGPELSDSEEAQRLRRARRYFGLSGTNLTGPLGLQTPAPVYRPTASPVPTAKRKLGA